MSRKPRPVLHELPYRVQQRIAGNVEEYTDKMALRAFNADFCQIIGDPKAHIDQLMLCCYGSTPAVLIIKQNTQFLRLSYLQTEHGCRVRRRWNSDSFGSLVRRQNNVQAIQEDFQSYLNNPNLTVGEFRLMMTYENREILSELMTGKLKVERFFAQFSGDQIVVVPVLSHLDAEFLKKLELMVWKDLNFTPVGFSELVKLDQWKNVQELRLCDALSPIIPLEHWWNVPIITIKLGCNLDQVPAMIEHFRRAPSFQECNITTSLCRTTIRNRIGQDLPWIVEDGVVTLRYPAEANRNPLRISVNCKSIKIERY